MNIINAIINLVHHHIVSVADYTSGNNRANNMGVALEEYVKDLFADSFQDNSSVRLEKINSVFSYLGNNSNPPDAMLKNGDAIEIKKIETFNASLALNSSCPKHKLYANSRMISKACRDAEKWTEKDIIYVVGVVKKNELKRMCMVYGMDYCASEECYNRIRTTIKDGVESISGVEFSNTDELGRINKVDPLGITYLRVRGMWGIENPWSVFNYIYECKKSDNFQFMCLINIDKWNSLKNRDLLLQLTKTVDNLHITNVRIKNPDNPALLNDAKLITFEE